MHFFRYIRWIYNEFFIYFIFFVFFGLWLNFFRLCQPYQTCSFFLIPILLGFYDFSRDKSFNFFGCSSFILFSKFLHYKKFKFFYFIFWLLTIPLLLYAEKVEEDTNLQKSSIFISKQLLLKMVNFPKVPNIFQIIWEYWNGGDILHIVYHLIFIRKNLPYASYPLVVFRQLSWMAYGR